MSQLNSPLRLRRSWPCLLPMPYGAWECGKTTVFLHEPSTLRSPSHPACLRFNILVQQNNIRETRSDMSKANRSQITCVFRECPQVLI
jgi:hypothetical protein